MKERKKILFLIGIIIFAGFLRLWNLGKVPRGFYSDEALYGYEAYSLFQTGKDQFGNKFPLSIAGFGDYRPAFYIYATIPFIAILGLTEFATRLPSAISSLVTLLVLYSFVKEVSKSSKTALLSILIFSVSPWSLYFARMAHETNFMTLLIFTGVLFLFKARRKKSFILISIILFAASLYTYHTARVFVPLFLIFSSILFFSWIKRNYKYSIIALIFFIILILPLSSEFQGESMARVREISLWTDLGLISRINVQRTTAIFLGTHPILAKLLYSKLTFFPLAFTKNFISHFDANFLIFRGDTNGIYNTPNNGILLWVEPILITLGLVYLWKNKRKFFWWILGVLLIILIPDSLTRVAPSSARIQLALPFISFLSGIGLLNLIKNKILGIICLIILVTNSLWFWNNYLSYIPYNNSRAWQIGTKEMILKSQKLANYYDKIWISREGWGWIHILFHTKYDPVKFHKEVKIDNRNELGFWWVKDIGKYHLDWFPPILETNENRLYIGVPSEFPKNTIPFDKIIHPITQEELFWFVESKTLEKIENMNNFEINNRYR